MSADNPTLRLEALQGITDETESANPDPAAQQAAQAEQARASEADMAAKQWGMLIYTIGGMCQMIAPELKEVYSEQRCFDWGQQANAVAEKYGWNGPSAMPELALLASTAGFFVPTFFMMREKIRAAQTGNTPAGLAAKVGMWWRMRKTRNAKNAGVTDVDPKNGRK